MTLKDEFEMTMISFLIEKKQDATILDHFQKIADDYAIEFAEWYHSANNNEYHLYPKKNIKEHLEIFKKEKGL
jgi:division protein CdvB (Snf7/Vps24/ESCRT-III family)